MARVLHKLEIQRCNCFGKRLLIRWSIDPLRICLPDNIHAHSAMSLGFCLRIYEHLLRSMVKLVGMRAG